MYVHAMAANETQGAATMQTITISELATTMPTKEDLSAVREELEMLAGDADAVIYSTDGERVSVVDDAGDAMRAADAINALQA